MISLDANSSSTTSSVPRSRFLIFFAAYSLALAVRLILFVQTGYTTDDAFITFRYAENIAAGNGFVYNEGQKVLGTTTPLFALALALLLKLNLSCFISAFFLNNLADLATGYVLLWMFREEEGPISWLPAVLFVLSPESLQWSLSGMETHVYISFLFLGFYFASKESWIYAFLMAALAVLTRIDGIALLGALLVTYVLRYSRLPVVPLGFFILAVLPWILFASVYFGSPLPNSAAAKWALSGEKLLSAPAEILFRGFLHLKTFGIPIFVLAIAGTRHIWRTQRQWLPLAVWTWGYALSYTVAAGPMHPWYYAPFYAGYLAIVFQGLAWMCKRYSTIITKAIQATIWITAIIIVLLSSYYRFLRIETEQNQMALNRKVGEWMRTHSEPDVTLSVKDIGYIGYYSHRKILDLAGLISPECIPFRAKGDFLGPIRKFHPEYFAFSAGQARSLKLESDELMKSYKLVSEIKNQDGTYLIFQNIIK